MNKPEKGAFDIKYIVPIISFIFIIIMLILMVAMPKERFSENENRYLQKFPVVSIDSIKSGKFMSDFDLYMSDHYIGRSFWVSFKAMIEISLGKTENNGIYIGKDNYLIQKYDSIDKENLDKISESLNKFKNSNKDVDMTFILAPNSVEINKDKLPKSSTPANQMEAINYFYDKLSNEYEKIEITEDLKQAKLNYKELYFRLDHHWTGYSAYIAYKKYCVAKDIRYNELSDYNIDVVSDNFKGTMYSKSNIYHLKPDIIEAFNLKRKTDYAVMYVNENKKSNSLYIDKYLDEKDKYSYFLDNNRPLTIIQNNREEKRGLGEIVILKDSYANILIPFLADHYYKIHVIDPRYYGLSISDYIKENKISEILFVYNLMTMEKDMGILSIR